MLVDLQPSDPLTYGAALGILAIVALAAILIPAARAAHADPMATLRAE
jgi:ABC-type lipoprotein release transport system permease subunit